jgi:PPOX class probable FMN-dependent enzyme
VASANRFLNYSFLASMSLTDDPHAITDLTQLQALLGPLSEASLKKETPYVHTMYRKLIEASPFAILATLGPEGLDASPRGDPAGFVAVENDGKTLLLPERRGNNRADSLRNILHDPRVALLFLVPGVGETLRVNGRAAISVEPALLQRFAMEGKLPRCVLKIQVDTVFFQCARAMQRSRLWQPVAANAPRPVPTPGAMLAAITQAAFDGETYDRELPARQRATLY